ncbi:subtilisin-like protease SBT1.1 isoform X2 [Vigna radiata var. radiata]|uniref:Subtilisin-like protease SBT1.1 isoform X2 n=1 Tax=Vigna radiata var. radiata TaxID=3916 RepID=A0A1S3TSD9_VIGRR|nr:subtilisin-like protease SBT1.1 isoform X2 [Vigna radiata var. radiata]
MKCQSLSSFFAGIMIFRTLVLFLAFMVANSTALADQQTYIVHIDKTKIRASIHSQDSSKPWFESIIDFISEAATQEDGEEEILAPQLLYAYETSMFGFAAHLSKKHLKYLNQVEGFLSAIPDELSTLHTTYSPQFLGLRSRRELWTASNLANDVIIGVLDSGIWPEHTSFQDSGLSPVPSHWKGVCEKGTKFSSSNCNKKLIGARAYFKGYEKYFGKKINETVDYLSPRDSQGHGTHTASTAAGDMVKNANFLGQARGTATGMRYTSRIAAYKVCWSSGCTNSDVLAAMDQAVSDGVDVLSLSLGSIPKPFYSDSIAIASFGATQKGVLVACSAGNSGPFPSTVGNGAPWIMTVAASSTDRTFPTKVKLGNGQIFKGSSLYQGKKTTQMPLVYGKSAGATKEAQYCTGGSLDPKLVHGKIVACERGINGRTEKGEEVKVAGGSGMILLNNEYQGEELFADPHILPATSLGASASKIIRSYSESVKKPTASISFMGTKFRDPAPVMAAFSSRGPSLVGSDVIKPDVTAPGVNILAAWPPKISPSFLKSDKRKVSFNILSGTSMSCPHVSGIAALLKSLHKDWSPAAIKSALMTTAYTLNNKGAPISDMASNDSPLATPFVYGSGHVNPVSASDPGLVYDISTKDYFNYLCSINYTSSQIALLSRSNLVCSRKAVLKAGDLNYPSFAVLFGRSSFNSSVTYRRVVTNVGKSRSSYAVKVEQPNGVSVSVEPRKLKFEKLGQKLSYNVTFLATGGGKIAGSSSFGSLIWVSDRYKVTSPIAITWQ